MSGTHYGTCVLHVSPESAERRKQWTPPASACARGYTRIFQHEVTQAHLGCDFASLAGNAPTPEPPIY